MCATCGCSPDGAAVVTDLDDRQQNHAPEHPHPHPHDHPHPHPHPHPVSSPDLRAEPPDSKLIVMEQEVLAKNDVLAAGNRSRLEASGTVVINLMSSPGSGKTTLLERTIRTVGSTVPISVVEGDQATLLDANRIRATGCRVVQVNTGAGCHLDADMVRRAMDTLAPPAGSLVVIENVGNLVCPALFDLGENARVVVMSVTEGEDKPLKYPHMFRTADLVLLNKIDLLPYVDFDVEAFTAALRAVRPLAEVCAVSATKGDGMENWYAWLSGRTVQNSLIPG
jgi:hydrogenase nickel incorporation protein HypB